MNIELYRLVSERFEGVRFFIQDFFFIWFLGCRPIVPFSGEVSKNVIHFFVDFFLYFIFYFIFSSLLCFQSLVSILSRVEMLSS